MIPVEVNLRDVHDIPVRELDLIPVEVLVDEIIPVDVVREIVREPIAGNLLRKQIKEHLTLPSEKERIEEIKIIQRFR